MIVATRLHLGNATCPPSDLQISKFVNFCMECGAHGVIAVDATPKLLNYDLVESVRKEVDQLSAKDAIAVLPVTPWGKFVPALNALITYAASHPSKPDKIMFVSAETSAPESAINQLLQHLDPDTLVVGAVLPGHDYRETCSEPIKLTGTTSPWNTLAVWNLPKLALTGFLLVSDGLLTDDATEPSYGVEEVMAIATIQKLKGAESSKAKLVKLADVSWARDFQDSGRKIWHQEKMQSKIQRAERQLRLAGLAGLVYHC